MLHQNDEVVVFLFQHLTVAAQAGVDLADLGHLLFSARSFSITQKMRPSAAAVLAGAVRLVGGQLQMLVDGALLVVVQARVHGLRHGQGVDIGRLKLDAAPLGRCPQKADIKGVGVVGHQNAAICKLQKGFQRLGSSLGASVHHLVGDAGQLGDLGGDGLAGLDKGVKLLHHLAVPDDDRADLGQVLHTGVKAGGLGIKHAELARPAARSFTP